jgi:hypothetical protein
MFPRLAERFRSAWVEHWLDGRKSGNDAAHLLAVDNHAITANSQLWLVQ